MKSLNVNFPDEIVKIGSTKNPEKRLREFNIIDPYRAYEFYDLRFFKQGYYEAEKILHYVLDECRIEGEWFQCSPDKARGLLQRLHSRKE